MITYDINQVCGFRKVAEQWGIFSNMSPHPVFVNEVRIPTTEALYQAMKYPHNPDLQRKIIEQKSPMAAKMVQKGQLYRGDWDQIKIEVMKWCLQLKLVYHSSKIRKVYEECNGRDIVEVSHKDQFWGAVPKKNDPTSLVGLNVLGNLWDDVLVDTDFTGTDFLLVNPPDIPELLLYNDPVLPVDRRSIRSD